MPENAALRAQRLLDLVPYLQSRPGITVGEIASEFNISKAEVLKDLNLLFMCGLPGYTHLELIDIAFDDDIVQVIDAQNLQTPRNLTESETLALRIALQALSDLIPSTSQHRAAIATLLGKLSTAFASSLPDGVVAFSAPRSTLVLRQIELAMRELKQVKISYLNRAKDERRERVISPLRVIVQSSGTSVMAWCHDSDAIRTFIVDNIESAELLESTAKVDVSADLDTSASAFCRTSHRGSDFLQRYRDVIEWSNKDEFIVHFFNREWLTRIALSSASEMEIIEPREVRREISERARKALANYR